LIYDVVLVCYKAVQLYICPFKSKVTGTKKIMKHAQNTLTLCKSSQYLDTFL